MKISNKLPPFGDKPIFLLVTSTQEAALYRIEGDELSSHGRFEIKRPENTDVAGMFQARARGRVMRSGTVFERDDSAQIRDFVSKMRRFIGEHLRDREGELYAFAPAQVKGHIQGILSGGALQKLACRFFEGNYMHNDELDLLDKIALERGKKKIKPATPEAERILGM